MCLKPVSAFVYGPCRTSLLPAAPRGRPLITLSLRIAGVRRVGPGLAGVDAHDEAAPQPQALPAGFEALEALAAAAEWAAALAAVAVAAGPGAEGALEEAALLVEGIAWEVGLGEWAADAAEVTGPLELGAAELLECLGAEGVADVVAWAAGVLAGAAAGEPPGELEALASCAGWRVGPEGLPESLAAAAALVTVNAALHQRG